MLLRESRTLEFVEKELTILKERFQKIFPDVRVEIDRDGLNPLSYKECYVFRKEIESLYKELHCYFSCYKEDKEITKFLWDYDFTETANEVLEDLLEEVSQLKPKYSIDDSVVFTEDYKDINLSNKVCTGKIVERFISCYHYLCIEYWYKVQDSKGNEHFISEDSLGVSNEEKASEILEAIYNNPTLDYSTLYCKVLEILNK